MVQSHSTFDSVKGVLSRQQLTSMAIEVDIKRDRDHTSNSNQSYAIRGTDALLVDPFIKWSNTRC